MEEDGEIMVQAVLIDTDIIVDFLRTDGGLLPKLVGMQQEGAAGLFISSITMIELFAGDSASRQAKLLEELFGQFRIVPVDQVLARFVGEAKRGMRVNIALGDFVIGMTAVWLGAKLATKNQKHFAQIEGLKFFEV